MHIKTHIIRDSNLGCLFLEQMRCPLRHNSKENVRFIIKAEYSVNTLKVSLKQAKIVIKTKVNRYIFFFSGIRHNT
jgi:hypothetical protein